MKKVIVCMFLVILFSLVLVPAALAGKLNPGYSKEFGYGVVVASVKGYPSYDNFDKSQFNYDKTTKEFSISAGDTLDLRAIYPKGKLMRNLVNEVKAKYKKLLADKTITVQEIGTAFRIWKIDAEHPVPQKLSDEPEWNPMLEQTYNADEEFLSWDSSGLKWDEINGYITNWQENAKPGDKLYVLFEGGLRAKGEPTVENKQNPLTGQFEPTSVPGLLYLNYLPFAKCVITFK
jgi:hypothetical protein